MSAGLFTRGDPVLPVDQGAVQPAAPADNRYGGPLAQDGVAMFGGA